MARALHQLSDVYAKSSKLKAGRHADGGGLYLSVSQTGSRSWIFMWVPPGGKRREAGLGSFPAISLAKARAKAVEFRAAIAEGRDPLVERDKEKPKTFAEVADLFVDSMEGGWKNEKHRAQWRMTLSDAYCASIRPKPVASVNTDDLLEILSPIWTTKAETASRLRGRIERVLDFAAVKNWRPKGDNPAYWRGHLKNALPARQRLQRGHHLAMAFGDVPDFVVRLKAAEAMAARGLEFLILTAARSNEVLGARWNEIDFKEKIWTVPKERMKAGKEHRVPLSERALEIVKSLHETRINDLIFPGQKKDRPLSVMAFEMLLRRMKVDVTTHGFRSSFRDWVGDATSFPREVADACLAHTVGNAVELAYRRSDALEKRRKLLQAWANFVAGKNNIADLRQARNQKIVVDARARTP
jgi:integrase